MVVAGTITTTIFTTSNSTIPKINVAVSANTALIIFFGIIITIAVLVLIALMVRGPKVRKSGEDEEDEDIPYEMHPMTLQIGTDVWEVVSSKKTKDNTDGNWVRKFVLKLGNRIRDDVRATKNEIITDLDSETFWNGLSTPLIYVKGGLNTHGGTISTAKMQETINNQNMIIASLISEVREASRNDDEKMRRIAKKFGLVRNSTGTYGYPSGIRNVIDDNNRREEESD
jgi:hypothetical protein